MVPSGHANGRQLGATTVSRRQSVGPHPAEPVLVSSPMVGLPLLDRGYGRSATLALVEGTWPRIEALIARGEFTRAIDAMASLAADCHTMAARDPEEWQPTLDQSRGLIYDAIVTVAEARGLRGPAAAALRSCRVWDVTLRSGLDQRLATLEAGGL
jgi:hypothetical protein